MVGLFNRSIDRSGSVIGFGAWRDELAPEVCGWIEASGHNPSSGERHNSRAESTTPSNAEDVSISCSLCSNSGCDVCNPIRQPPLTCFSEAVIRLDTCLFDFLKKKRKNK